MSATGVRRLRRLDGRVSGPRRRHHTGCRATAPRRMERPRLVTSVKRAVAVVTGASRGAGLGIAHALGSHGCTVYVTGRTEKPGQSPLTGTIHETAELVTAAGGEGVAVAVDHADDEQTRALFDRVAPSRADLRHPRQQRRGHPRRDDGPNPVLGETDQRHRHPRRRPPQRLRRHRLRGPADDSAAPRTASSSPQPLAQHTMSSARPTASTRPESTRWPPTWRSTSGSSVLRRCPSGWASC